MIKLTQGDKGHCVEGAISTINQQNIIAKGGSSMGQYQLTIADRQDLKKKSHQADFFTFNDKNYSIDYIQVQYARLTAEALARLHHINAIMYSSPLQSDIFWEPGQMYVYSN